jgi:hypothetical protein
MIYGDDRLAVGAGVSSIVLHEHEFSLDAFVPFARAVFVNVRRAQALGRLDEVHHLLADGLWTELQTEGPARELAGPVTATAAVVRAGEEGAWDTVVVRFATQPSPGRGGVARRIEDWTFQRPARETQTAGEPATQERCPMCDAPITLAEDGTCRYCHVAVAGGRGGWRVVRLAAAPIGPASAVPASAMARRRPFRWLALALAVVLLPGAGVALALEMSGSFKPGDSATPSAAAGGLITGQGSFAGAITGTADGDLVLLGGDGPCAVRARDFTGLSFTHTESSDGGSKLLTTVVNMPPGVRGPGGYDMATTAFRLTESYQFRPDDPRALAKSQVWTVQPGRTKAVLDVRSDGSGTLTVMSLAPASPRPANDSLGGPLDLTLSFTCH